MRLILAEEKLWIEDMERSLKVGWVRGREKFSGIVNAEWRLISGQD